MIEYLFGLYVASVILGFLGIMYSYSYDRATYRDGLLSKVKYDRISRKYKRLLVWLPIWPVGIVYHLCYEEEMIYRAGWKSRNGRWQERFGRWWVWIGPYVIGDTRRF